MRPQADQTGHKDPRENCQWSHKIDDSQFGIVPERGTTNAIFLVCQLQEKYQAVIMRLYTALVDLKNTFNCVQWNVKWWALRKVGVGEWIVQFVQGMYANAQNQVHVGEGYSQEFEVKVRVHQGSVLSPHCLLAKGMCHDALDMERSYGEEGIKGKCRKDKGHDLLYRPRPPAEFR